MDPITIAALASAAAGVMNASKPAPSSLPTSASTIFGSSMFAVDSSGWLVNFGDAATQSQTQAAKTGPSLTASATPVNTSPGGYSAVGAGGGIPLTGAGQSISGSVSGAIPTSYLFIAGGALLLIMLLKRK